MAEPDDSRDVLEALASFPSVHHPTASPDGETVAVYYDDTGRNELQLIDVASGDREVVTDGEVPRDARWPMKWAPDGEALYFHRDEAGNEQNDVWRVARDGTDAGAVLEMDGQVSLEAIGDDGTLYVGSTAGGQLNLYRRRTDGEVQQLTDYERAVGGPELSPDGDRIAYTTNETDAYENLDVYVAAAEGSDPQNLRLGEVGSESQAADWAPDGESLLVSDNATDRSRPGVYDVETGEVSWFGPGEHDETAVAFLADGRRFVAVRTRRAAKVPVVYDVETGEGVELDVPEGVTVPAGGSPRVRAGSPLLSGDRLLLLHTTPDRRPELLAYDLETDETEVLLPAEYGPFDPDTFADAEYFRFASDGVPETRQAAVEHDPYDELEIGALLYDPRDAAADPEADIDAASETDDEVPLIVKPHGGPRHADTRSFDLYTQFLCQRGFAVLEVNYRGSTGRGRAFVRELYDDWGGAEQGDVVSGLEHVLATREWVDDDRVAVFGGSYGGYSAYWQLVQYPDRYDAGIAWMGLTDLEAMYEETMPHFKTELLEKNVGTPADNPELYRERSPIEYAENLSAPALLVHGVNDRRVPVSQARTFRDRLAELGYEEGEAFEYVELGEEGHASSDQAQKLRLFEILDDFLERRL